VQRSGQLWVNHTSFIYEIVRWPRWPQICQAAPHGSVHRCPGRSAAAQDEAAPRAPPDAGAKPGGADRGAPAGAASLHRVTPAPTDQAGTLYRKGRRSDSGLLPLPEGALAAEFSGVSEPTGPASQAPRLPASGAGGEPGGGAPAAAGAAGREPAPGRAGQGDAREGTVGDPGAEAVYGTGPGSPAAAAAGQFWLSAAAAGTGPGQGVASHRVELAGACRRTLAHLLIWPCAVGHTRNDLERPLVLLTEQQPRVIA